MPPAFKAQLVINTRPGPRPKTIEIHRVRVDDAAKELDTMGPPIARLAATSGPWAVTTTPDPDYGAYITTVQGADGPTGSWKRVWYRATAWTAEDPTRGGLKGRSSASNAVWVVLPPTDPPVLSALSIGGGPTLAGVHKAGRDPERHTPNVRRGGSSSRFWAAVPYVTSARPLRDLRRRLAEET
jgi:hypothetical protein